MPKKKAEQNSPLFLCSPKELLFNRSANRAVLCAVATADALISIDNKLVAAFGNARYGASICTCAAVDALVGNLVCHVKIPPLVFFSVYIVAQIF